MVQSSPFPLIDVGFSGAQWLAVNRDFSSLLANSMAERCCADDLMPNVPIGISYHHIPQRHFATCDQCRWLQLDIWADEYRPTEYAPFGIRGNGSCI